MTHIVDTLIEERASGLMRHPLVWRLIMRTLQRALGYHEAVAMADTIASMSGAEVFEYMSDLLALDVAVDGLEEVPDRGAVVVMPNHPTGVADGVAVYDALKRVREDIVFFANRDALRVSPGMEDMIVPVEWVEEKRTLTRQRETLRAATAAFRRQQVIVLFPSGRLARPSFQGLMERPWQTTAISLAKKHNSPVMPMHIRAHNSWLFYLFWLLHDELRDITVFRELLNKKEVAYEVRIGAMFEPEGDVKALTDDLRRFVTEQMPRGVRTWRGMEQQSSASLSSG